MRYTIDLVKLGASLKQKRGSRGLRQTAADISQRIGAISPSTLSRLERREFDDLAVSTLLTICTWLDVPPAEFFTDTAPDRPTARPDLPLAQEIEHRLLSSDLEPGRAAILAAAVRAGIEAG